MIDALAAIPLDRLIAIVPEIVEVLRADIAISGPRGASSPGRTDSVICAADRLFAGICDLAESVELDLTGIPTWRNGWGRIIGMRPSTRVIHVSWILEDIVAKTAGTPDRRFVEKQLRWIVAGACRSPNIASVILGEAEQIHLKAVEAEFADIKAFSPHRKHIHSSPQTA